MKILHHFQRIINGKPQYNRRHAISLTLSVETNCCQISSHQIPQPAPSCLESELILLIGKIIREKGRSELVDCCLAILEYMRADNGE